MPLVSTAKLGLMQKKLLREEEGSILPWLTECLTIYS
jgi:hypothetical protein